MLNYLFEALEQVDKEEDNPNKAPNEPNQETPTKESTTESKTSNSKQEINGDSSTIPTQIISVQTSPVAIKSEISLDNLQNTNAKTPVINLSNGVVKPVYATAYQGPQISVPTLSTNGFSTVTNLSSDQTQVILTPLARMQLRNRHIIGIEEKEAHIEVKRGKETKDKRLLVDVFWEVYEPNSADGARPLSEEPAAVFVIPREDNKVSLKLKLPTDIGSKHLRSKEKNDIALRVECYMDLSKERYKSKPVATTSSNKFVGLLKRKQLSEADQKQRDMFIPSGEKKSNKRRKGHSPPPVPTTTEVSNQ